ncbi:putative nuclease HARBI1 [Ruditapes philippinarum]|uniref:putative nuclease HARBI1 n=1 Tax=Ruditapes philippinarum TaxID=129788 RepID=UPI00295BC301|nr:putative nuclease HARBI1 [Ruditapes philippinarum]
MIRRYRFSNEGVNYIVNLLENDIKRSTKRNHAISPRNQVLLALRFFASGSMYEVIGDTCGFSKSTVSRAVDSVTDALVSHIHEFVRWPHNEDKKKISSHFYDIAGFPNVIGCIDGTHVRIQAPKTDEASFVNRKGYHSISVQAVCDNEGKFTSVNASWPGSCHDSHVFRTSGLCQRLEKENKSFSDGVLLGDSGYPCRPFIMTPFLATDSAGKMRYQESHTKTRVTIERAFGQLKRRFHVLHSEIRLAPAKVCRVVTACVILHNIAHFLHESDVEEFEVNDLDVDNERCLNDRRDGAAVREFFVQQYFA